MFEATPVGIHLPVFEARRRVRTDPGRFNLRQRLGPGPPSREMEFKTSLTVLCVQSEFRLLPMIANHRTRHPHLVYLAVIVDSILTGLQIVSQIGECSFT